MKMKYQQAMILVMTLQISLCFSNAQHRIATEDGLFLKVDNYGVVTGVSIDGRQLKQSGVGGFFIAEVKSIEAKEVELVKNSSFEFLKDGKPIGFSIGSDWSVDEKISHSGKVSMKVIIPEGQKRSSGALAVEIPVKPNTPYQVSMWMRTQGGAPCFYIVQMDAQGKTHPDYPQICVSHSRYHSDWFRLTHSFVTAFFCRRILVYTNLWQQTGTAWVDDVSVICLDDDYITPQRLVVGKVQKTKEGIRQVCEVKDLSLFFQANYRAMPNYIVIDGEIRDTSKQDRAITISFRLPIDAVGWTWFEDIHNEQMIEDGIRYGSARLLSERGVIALYPFSAISNGKNALAIAVPMDMPRIFRICYERRFGYFINYEFGLSQDTKKFPGSAWFKFLIYKVDPKWGFRSAAKRYYEFFPQFFVKRVEDEGCAGFMVDKETIESPKFIAPKFAIFDYQHRDAIEAHRQKSVKLFSYTEFVGWWGWAIGITAEKAKIQPTPEEAWAYVEKLAHSEPAHKVAQCILNCVPYDRDGKRRLHHTYVPEWGGYNYLCNPDPEIEGVGGKVNRYTLTYEREVSLVDAYNLDGMYFDCGFVFAVDNFRREHFKWADNPLAFDHISKKPIMPMAFSIYECTKSIADDMHRRGKLVMANYSVTDHPTDMFCIQFIDIIGNEMLWTWTTDAKLALQRTLAYQKNICMSWQEAKKDWERERIESEMKHAMFYGTFYYLSTMDRVIYESWHPLTVRLANAGWEPITYASSSDRSVIVERFGSIAKQNLHFTLRNKASNAKTIELIFDSNSLGLKEENVWLMLDSFTCKKMEVKRAEGKWLVKLHIPPNDTVVLRLGKR
ncbi:MAG: hypothetical protein RMK18_11580 [Armatimonadota bacterium]|nr:hypothetical protein [Armatimonadota bacterium]MDW8026486.1 hypothetical protein [Armatimonadota bacterium]